MSAIDDELKPIDPPKAATKRGKAHWPDLIVGGSAIVIAVISLAVALRQSQIMERQLAASVWPYLQYHTSNATDDGQRVISFGVENVGVGPARVHSVSMRYADKPIRNVDELWTACCADLLASKGNPAWRISSLHNQVLAPNRPKTFLQLTNSPSNQPYWERLNAEQSKIQLKTCYCSVLGECWMLDSSKDEHAPIAVCPAPQADDYVD
ncbi:MAG: hypothetical protein WC213_00555 [Arenimonas sp.]|jgi:hypothetical protein